LWFIVIMVMSAQRQLNLFIQCAAGGKIIENFALVGVTATSF